MSLEIIILFAGVFASGVIFYRLGLRHGNDCGYASGFTEGRDLTVTEKAEAWQNGYFAHKRTYDEAKVRQRDDKGRFTPKMGEVNEP
jgi:hypothetical protein